MKIVLLSLRDDDIALIRRVLAPRVCTTYSPAAWRDALADEADLLILDLDDLTASTTSSALLNALQAWRVGGQPRAMLLLTSATARTRLALLREAGADDYLVKPLRRHELGLRLDLLCRAVAPDDDLDRPETFGEFVFSAHGLRVSSTRRPLDMSLTRKESELARLLLSHLARPLSRAFIGEQVWGGEPDVATRTIDTHISRVRTKLGLKLEQGYRLATVYGYGYQLDKLESGEG